MPFAKSTSSRLFKALLPMILISSSSLKRFPISELKVITFRNSGSCLVKQIIWETVVLLRCFQAAKDNVSVGQCLHGGLKSDNTCKVVKKLMTKLHHHPC
ncbi:uncharacterized protein BYT42DRAFT_586557 [Radiomyces spectabilis]|uniref:uncharacterized protein n=1 Tax=Radiomyces spectabilis TaxID=64574 RepID=UPI00221F915D|nr:uncharacterized protein BYT42DRAFT_586557 [Radiomyces spectabilis]KAI8367515.1 hypothetical protein BYT42DRAFT_586557 [Radiomyces spectabilis]